MKSKLTKILTYACVLCYLIFVNHSASAGQLSVTIENPTQIAGDSFVSVFLDGDIDSDAPIRLNEHLKRIPPNSAISFHLNSNGGNLLAGMELGRIIRKIGASTSIAKRGADQTRKYERGECYSACSLAYLGGLYRYADEKTVFGIHRISSSVGPTNKDLDIGQILSAAVSAYIAEMGVDAKLFTLMAKTDSDDIYVLSNKQMKELRVANNGRSPAEWEVKVVPGGYYLRGQQETYFGFGKVVFSCVSRKIIFMSVYSAGEKAPIIAAGGWMHALRVGNDEFPLPEPNPVDISAKDGMIISSFVLTNSHIQNILKAKSVGHSMKPTTMAAFFVGYDVDIDEGDKSKVRDYLQNCK